MRRREVVAGLAAAVASPAVKAQPVPLVGFLHSGSPAPNRAHREAFRSGLAEAGFMEGRNVMVEERWAESDLTRLSALAAELVARPVSVLATGGGELPLRAAKRATSKIPIVSTIGGDPVAAGHVASLARPGGNLTGVSFLTVELTRKRVHLLLECAPSTIGVALLVNPLSPQTAGVIEAVRDSVALQRLRLVVLQADAPAAIGPAVAGIDSGQADALVIQADPLFVNEREQLAALALGRRLPAIHEARAFVRAGGLISYGADLPDVYRLVGEIVGRVLKGANPAELPVQQPTRFELAINLKTAGALGLTVPPSLLAQADDVLE